MQQTTMPTSMLEATVAAGPTVTVSSVPLPDLPSTSHLRIKVVACGINPKDWKNPEILKNNLNQGEDISGIVAAVGDDVREFQVGDRVAAMHGMLQPGGGYAEYAVVPKHTTFHLADSVSFEQGATVPLAAMTAALGLYQRLRLPVPWSPNQDDTRCPLLIYGASSAVGAFAVKLATLSNIHPIICVAGKGSHYVEGLIDRSRGDVILDYRTGDLIAEIKKVMGQTKLKHVFDAVSENGSLETVASVIDPDGSMVVVLPGKRYTEIPNSVNLSLTQVGKIHHEAYPGIRRDSKPCGPLGVENDKVSAAMFFKFFGLGLANGFLSGHPETVVLGGLYGLKEALTNLKTGKASATKYVVLVDQTFDRHQTMKGGL